MILNTKQNSPLKKKITILSCSVDVENEKHFKELTSHKCIFIWTLDKIDLNQESSGFIAREECHLEIVTLVML